MKAPMSASMSAAALASDTLRSELIFLPDDGSLLRIDGGFVMRMPSNPGFWWGNTLRLDRPPGAGDFERWTALFRAHVHAVQPESTHMTFGWSGDETGSIEPFVAAGFTYFEILSLGVDRIDQVVTPWPDDRVQPAPVTNDEWPALQSLLVEMRDPWHGEADYTAFIARRIDGWRALEARGQGGWFAVREGDAIVAALGVFAEAARGPDDRRIGRFQHVHTHPAVRRRGLAGQLVAHASRHAFERLDVDMLLISADEHEAARRVYEACGYRIRSRHRGLERATAPGVIAPPSS